MRKIIGLILLTVLLSACLPSGMQIPQSPALRFLEIKSGTIAYIGNDGNIHITDSGATFDTALTDDLTEENRQTTIYRLPTWSQDSNQLAFTRLEQKGQNNLSTQVFIANLEDETVNSIYSNEQEFPIYIHWSPNNQSVGMLSNVAGVQKIILKNLPTDGSMPQVLDTGNPFYWSWAPNGSDLLIHKNGINNSQQLSFLKTDTDINEYVLDEIPASFQTPAWSPSGEFILISTLSDDKKKQLVLTDSTGANPKVISEFDLNVAFAWAQDSEQYAYIIGDRQLDNGAIGALHVGDIFGREEIIIEQPVIGFFWSPDGRQLAYFIPFLSAPENEDGTTGEQAIYLSIHVLDVSSGKSQEIAVYQPSQDFFEILPYFDQHHQSMTIWSPDSNNLVISFMTQEGAPAIAIVPASGVTEPRFLAEGRFAVWSWK